MLPSTALQDSPLLSVSLSQKSHDLYLQHKVYLRYIQVLPLFAGHQAVRLSCYHRKKLLSGLVPSRNHKLTHRPTPSPVWSLALLMSKHLVFPFENDKLLLPVIIAYFSFPYLQHDTVYST